MLLSDGVAFFVEFKRPDGKLSKLQEREIARIRKLGHACYVVSNITEAKALLEKYGVDPE